MFSKVITCILFLFLFFKANVIVAQVDCTFPPPTNNCDPIIAVGTGTETFFTPFSGANFDFTFDSFGKFLRGITYYNAGDLRLIVRNTDAPGHPVAIPGGCPDLTTCHWKLDVHLDNREYNTTYTAPTAAEWAPKALYGGTLTGPYPTVDLFSINIHNECGTPDLAGAQSIATTASRIKVIEHIGSCNGSEQTKGALHTCSTKHTNVPGSYLADTYGEYHFYFDLTVTPTLSLKPGLYFLRVHFCLSEDQ